MDGFYAFEKIVQHNPCHNFLLVSVCRIPDARASLNLTADLPPNTKTPAVKLYPCSPDIRYENYFHLSK
jgi:hypothetical protein